MTLTLNSLLVFDSYWKNVINEVKRWKYEELDEPTQYAYNVAYREQSDPLKILASKMVFYQCARHLLFLYKQKHDPDFNYVFDLTNYKAINSYASKIIIPQTGAPFVFTDFRKFMSGFVFCWVNRNDPSDYLTSEIFDIEARKQWKSSYWAMIALCVSMGLLRDGNPEVYFAGATRESSRIPYEIALNYIWKSPKLAKHYQKANTIRILSKKRGQIKALSFDTAALEGKNPSMVVLTEYHLHKDDTMVNSAMYAKNTSRKNFIVVYDTTKGTKTDSVCYYREQAYKTFLEQQIKNPATLHENANIFLFCAELDEEDYESWDKPELWKKANPGLDITVSLKDLKSEFHQITSNAQEVEFKIKRLGMWVNNASSYFSMFDIMENQRANENIVKPYIENNFKDLQPLLGLDLSSVHDVTGLIVHWEIPQDDGDPIWVFKGQGFLPESNIQRKEDIDHVPYRYWEQKGWMSLTPGEVVDYKIIKNVIKSIKDNNYGIILLYDSWCFNIVKRYLLDENIFSEDQLIAVKQGVWLTPVFKELDRKIRMRKIYIVDDNELIINHLLNVSIKETSNGNYFIKKISQYRRIDLAMAMLNSAAYRYQFNENKEKTSFYELIN
ncbi:terminase TerL endonuclease subunit [Mycoplasma seminis]|uniref:Terminase large subunit n=1 Tax=Mycoplasma seminis TaxID=512749 RepID=A0ABY9H9N5_9MOLU|nr:terminase TerL endonuclease subunit [Mycoplasma seminis]WLP85292.1 terminase large subunit [Mycoplasma seminis]